MMAGLLRHRRGEGGLLDDIAGLAPLILLLVEEHVHVATTIGGAGGRRGQGYVNQD